MDEHSVRTKLGTFTPTGNETEDFQTLYELAEEWKRLPQQSRRALIPDIFHIFEQHPSSTSFGTPGPLVHALEAEGGYELALRASLARAPSFYAVCMVNRILNANRGERERAELLSALQQACETPQSPESVRTQAQRFLNRHK